MIVGWDLLAWHWLLGRQNIYYKEFLRINMKFRVPSFLLSRLHFFSCLLFFYYLSLTLSIKKSGLEWGQWVPQGLEISAMSCIRHQILQKPYLRIHHHSHFWTLNPSRVLYINETFRVRPTRIWLNFFNKKYEFSNGLGLLSILVIWTPKVGNSKFPYIKRG